MESGKVSAGDWFNGITLSILASVIGAASKLAIRKSWLMQDGDEATESSINNDNTMPQPLTSVGTDPLSEAPVSLQVADDAERNGGWFPYLLRYSGMFGMSVLNPICCVLAMNYASPSILAPFSGLTLVWVVLLSSTVIGETPSTLQVVAAGLIVTGEVIVAVFGDHTNDEGVTIEDVVSALVHSCFPIL